MSLTTLPILPSPSAEAQAHSQQLCALLDQRMAARGGTLSFAEYMHEALYAPGLGYYSAGLRKLGAQGDFITAPELSPLFAYCLARQAAAVLAALPDGVILEFGAGSGKLAADLLAELERLGQLPSQYWILEISPDLRQRQRETLQRQVPHLLNRIVWLERLPATPLTGLIVANEVLDAMPVQCFTVDATGQLWERQVTRQESGYAWCQAPANSALQQAVAHLAPELPAPYHSEWNPALAAWIQALSDSLAAGLVLLIDYGFPRREYYHPQRDQGTLMCHYRHHAHGDPFWYPGLQDLTAHVDFTAVAEAAVAAGLQVAGYTTQAYFLLDTGLQERLSHSDPEDYASHLQFSQQVQKLIMPHEMGELFKVMGLSRHLEIPLCGFSHDQRHRL